jgi:amino-acid N-acetyltransferase
MGEIAGVAVDPAYRRNGFGRLLMDAIEGRARDMGLESVFVLTTQAHHWFMERGYQPGNLDALPGERRALYNYQRNSQVLTRKLR